MASMRENLSLGVFKQQRPAHPCSLISAFFIRLLESIISRLATREISIFYLQGFFSAFWEHDPTPRIGNFRVVLYKIGKKHTL